MKNHIVMYLFSEYYSGINSNEQLLHTKMGRSLYDCGVKNAHLPPPQEYVVCSDQCKVVFTERKEISCCLGMRHCERKGMIPKGTGDYGGDANVYYLIVVMDLWIYSYVKTHQIAYLIYIQYTVD